jgi:hypothetical protein
MSVNGQFSDINREKFNYLIKKNNGFEILKIIICLSKRDRMRTWTSLFIRSHASNMHGYSDSLGGQKLFYYYPNLL